MSKISIYPTRFTLLILSLWSLLAFLCWLFALPLLLWQISGLSLLLLLLLDAAQLKQLPQLQIQRQASSSLAVGVWSKVQLLLWHEAEHPCRVAIFDDYPQPSEIRDLPQNLRIPPRHRVKMRYQLRAQQRGAMHFGGVHIALTSRRGFWQLQRYQTLEQAVKVYPNFAAVTRYTLLATENRLGQLGIRQLQRRGEGLDFLQLREYRMGDSLRQIDWNATARQRKLISKEYQDERDQQVVFLLDCGRRMLARDGELSHFDHSLNAVLLLSYVALRQGDALGLMTFSGSQRWLSPRKGAGAINQVLNSIYDLQPSLHTSDYLLAAQTLMRYQRNRSLVILISNLRDEDSSTLGAALALLRQKHLVLLASLQESVLHQVLEQPIEDFRSAVQQAAVAEYLLHRRQAHESLTRRGVLHLDTEPQQLPVNLINHYLDIKRAGRL